MNLKTANIRIKIAGFSGIIHMLMTVVEGYYQYGVIFKNLCNTLISILPLFFIFAVLTFMIFKKYYLACIIMLLLTVIPMIWESINSFNMATFIGGILFSIVFFEGFRAARFIKKNSY